MKLARLADGTPEVFYSIQGEGPSLGWPSIFVRFSLCNLHCVWCDSDYTWNWKGTRFQHLRDTEPGYEKYEKSTQIIELSVAETVTLIQQFSGRNIILTGGEPMLHQHDAIELIEQLREGSDRSAPYRFEVETNGTILPLSTFDQEIAQYNVSPKLSNSGVPEKLRIKEEAIAFFVDRDNAHFKFVIDQDADIDEVNQWVERFSIPHSKILLMPQGITPEALQKRSEMLIEVCKQNGYRFSCRLHIQLYGSKRGV